MPANPYNPPVAQQEVLQGGQFSTAWYQWFAITVAKKLLALVGLNAPLTSADSGTAGDLRTDGTYLYICISANTWKRIALTAF